MRGDDQSQDINLECRLDVVIFHATIDLGQMFHGNISDLTFQQPFEHSNINQFVLSLVPHARALV